MMQAQPPVRPPVAHPDWLRALTARCGRVGAALPLIAALSGCAVVNAPSFDLMAESQRSGVPLGQYVPAKADAPPPGAITPITPTLVRDLRAARVQRPVDGVAALFDQAQPYRIGVNDSLSITVFGHPELALPATTFVSNDPSGLPGGTGYTVDSNGEITYPYIGRVKVVGLTAAEALELVQNRLARFLKEPQVGLRVSTYRSQRAYIDGEVRSPGVQILSDVPMTLPELLNRAGGLTPLADRSQVLFTRQGRSTPIDLIDLGERGLDPTRILVKANDQVRVLSREESRVYVLGEVAQPRPVFLRNGRLSLQDALGEVGGLNPNTSNPRQIYVIRGVSTAEGVPQATIYHLDARVASGLVLADAFPLQPRDVVFVDPVPLVAWNRILNLILPSAQAAITTGAVANIAAPR